MKNKTTTERERERRGRGRRRTRIRGERGRKTRRRRRRKGEEEKEEKKDTERTPVFLPGKSHGWRNLVGYSPRDRKESDTTERLHFTSFRTA